LAEAASPKLGGTAMVVICAAIMMEVVVGCFFWVDRATKRAEAAGEFRDAPKERAGSRAIGGDAWGGLVRTVRSPYLMGTGGYIVMMSIVSTFFYFAQMEIVRTTGVSSDHRTVLFSQIDVWSQVATLMVQLFLTSHMVRRLGVGPTLAALPVIAMVGFGAIALVPGFAVMAVSQAVYRAGRYAFARPARETLFTVLDREDRYKSKAFVDTFLFRGGDVLGAWADGQAKTFAKSMATAGTDATVVAVRTCAVAVCGIGVGWTALALWLGRAQRRRVAEGHAGTGAVAGAGATGTVVG
jgi:AAA family ATP:ADP antiporter